MYYAVYNLLLSVLAPVLRLYLGVHPKYSSLKARFLPAVVPNAKPPIWIQACSVGELNTAQPLVDAIARRFPATPILLTTSTMSGYALAVKRYDASDIQVMWMPFDQRRTVARCIESVNPRALLLVETEIWPNLLREADAFGIPVLIVNGRMSARHFKRYYRWRRFFTEVLQHLHKAGVQNELYAQRLEAVGLPQEKIQITGNMKFDAVTTELDSRTRNRLRLLGGFQADDLLLVFGSTRPGDEALALRCWTALRQRYPSLRLVLAPRHLERVPEIERLIPDPYVLRSQLEQPGKRDGSESIIVIDRMGELTAWYALAAVAVVGGTFYPGVEGHNPLEPAALGVPSVFGPHIANFADPAHELMEGKGAIQVQQPEGLVEELEALLADPAERRQLGTRGRKVVLQHQGAVENNVAMLEEVLMGPLGQS